jgi:hypothetical protein
MTPSRLTRALKSPFLLALALLVLARPTQAQFTYTVTNGAATITGYTGVGGFVSILASIGGSPVGTIGSNAFINGSNITGISMVNVTNLTPDAFNGCPVLSSIYFAGNAPSLEGQPFAGLNATIFYNSNTTGWISPFGGLTAIATTAFPEGSFEAFQTTAMLDYANSHAYDVFIQATYNGLPVTSIAESAFINANAISVLIPGCVTNIGFSAFDGCSALRNVNIPNGVTSIANETFAFCQNLTTISLPNSLTSIGMNVFAGSAVSSLNLSSNVTNIAEYAFAECGVTNVTISNNAHSFNIGSYAFTSCGELQTIFFTGNAPSNDPSIFSNDLSATVYYLPGTTGWGPTFGGVPTLIWDAQYNFGYTVTNNTATIESYLGSNNAVVIPNSINGYPVTGIGSNAFNKNSSLSSITLPAGLTNIASNAFETCSGLSNVYFTGPPPNINNVAGNAEQLMQDVFEGDPATLYYLPGVPGWAPPAIPWNPSIETAANFGVKSGQFSFTINATNALTVVIQAATNLVNPSWTPLQTNTITNGTWSFSEPVHSNSPARFYRLSFP